MNILKSMWAIVAGFLTVVVLSIGTDMILEGAGIFSSQTEGLFVTWMLVVAFVYRSLFAVAGGYVTAWLAPQNPMKHVIILGLFGIAGGVAGVVYGWDMSSHWYPIALAVTAFPLTYLGGKLKTK